jgi:Concanavalin A-like lectin/glucanases superfamily/Immunoglobulin I-set domain
MNRGLQKPAFHLRHFNILKSLTVKKTPTEGAAMKPSTLNTELLPSTRLRKAVFGGSLKRLCCLKIRFCSRALLAFACTAIFTNAAHAATASFTNNTPTLGVSDISQLANAVDRTNNVGGTNDDQGGNFVYLDNGRPAQGQTFITGGNANGYTLTAVTLKQVAYDTYALVPDITYHVRITSPSGSALTVLAEETAFVPTDLTDCATCNFPDNGCCDFLPGSGRYITFTFATPVVLNPNTTYGFDVGAASVGDHYWETDGTANTNAYTGGTAYSTGVAADNYGYGLGNTTLTERTGDRVFVVALTAAVAPLAPRINIPPKSLSLYSGRTAQFSPKASGSPTLVYQWHKNGTNVVNGGNVSGATTDSLSLANIAAGDAGSYTLVVTNSAPSGNSVTSAPAMLTVVAAPAPGSYGSSVLANNPSAFWRLDEIGNPATNPPASDYAGGFTGTYEIGSSNGFNGIAGPRPSAFPGFASANNAVQTTGLGDGLTPTWVTVPPLHLETNRVTMTAWIYSDGAQVDYCGLFEIGGGNAGFAYGGDFSLNAGQLIYWWSGATYTFVSGLVIPTNQWSFVAVVIEPTKADLYLGTNGVLNAAEDIALHEIETFGANGEIGHQPGSGPDNRVFNGSIDEVAVFNYAFTPAQVLNLYNAASSFTLNIQKVGANVVLSWPQGTLLEANDVTGPYTTNLNTSPYTLTPGGVKKFYRVGVQ